jgi:hypothetical protein
MSTKFKETDVKETHGFLILLPFQGTKEPRNQGTKEPRNQGTKEPRNQGTKEPGNQGTKEPRNQNIALSISINE